MLLLQVIVGGLLLGAIYALFCSGLTLIWYHREGHRFVSYPDRPWYRDKAEPSFADMLGTLRRMSWREQFPGVDWERGDQESALAQLVEFVSRAA